MIDYQRLFHTGFIVRDLREAMDRYGAALGVTWAQPRVLEPLGLWRPSHGYQELRLEYVYSREGPQHVELLKGSPGSYYDPETQTGFHVGLWADEVGAETADLAAKGWTVLASGAS